MERMAVALEAQHSSTHEIKLSSASPLSSAFYARLLSLTPKYFATVIKQTTGLSATQWINNYVIVQAKWMLQHEHHKTVQQIAHQLGFSEQASFSRFFKLHNGVSPTEYRELA
ncbi:MAG: helix-turn-helix domain-containing protein [Prevotella sp.]|nr:helix-turn-helix domain-containing protein [Prevotella sp.]